MRARGDRKRIGKKRRHEHAFSAFYVTGETDINPALKGNSVACAVFVRQKHPPPRHYSVFLVVKQQTKLARPS